MPKGTRRAKGKGGPQSRKDPNYQSSNMGSDEDSNLDNQSVFSVSSSARDGYGSDTEQHFTSNGLVGGDGEAQDDGYYDDFEDKLAEALDQTAEKSAKTRTLALEAIRKAFTSRYLYDFIEDRKVTVMDVLERGLKRGKGEEQGNAATLAAIVITTLGANDATDALFKEFETNLITTVNDATVSASIRAKCATALGLCCFVAGNGGDTIDSIMEVLLSVVSASFFKGNGAVPSHNPQITALHASALQAWCLLCTVQPTSVVLALAQKHIKRIIELLESSDVDLRIAAGETIAVLHEVSREIDESWEVDDADKLYEKLRILATDSQKFRAKKDRRVQRSSFRDVLKFVEEGEEPYVSVKFGMERLILDSWCKKHQYDAFCHVLGSGMNLHLSENDLLRDIFGLGPPLSMNKGVQKISKFERHMGNLAASRLRTKTRGKLRDKRADVVI